MKIQDLKKLMRDGRLGKIIIICGLVGIALIFISSFGSLSPEKSEWESFSAGQYKSDTQNELSSVLSQIEGVGKVSVFLTVDSAEVNVGFSGGASSKNESVPAVQGVLVVCEGGDDPVTVERVISAVTRSLNISSAKVCVSKMSG